MARKPGPKSAKPGEASPDLTQVRDQIDGIDRQIQELIALRCPITSTWMVNNQQATALIGAKPP